MPPIEPLGKRQGIGFRLYRTDAEMREVVLSNPFLAADVDEEHLHAIFLAEAPAPSNAASLDRSSRKIELEGAAVVLPRADRNGRDGHSHGAEPLVCFIYFFKIVALILAESYISLHRRNKADNFACETPAVLGNNTPATNRRTEGNS